MAVGVVNGSNIQFLESRYEQMFRSTFFSNSSILVTFQMHELSSGSSV